MQNEIHGTDGWILHYKISRTFTTLHIREQEVKIRTTPVGKQTLNWPNGDNNGLNPHNQQGQNDKHIRKILHIQRDKIQQQNQRQIEGKNQRKFEAIIHRDPCRMHTTTYQPDD